MFHDTAHVYDMVYEASGKDYAAESDEIHRLVQIHNPQARTLLDVASGTGGHLRHLQNHYEVSGIDLDPEMVAVGRQGLADVPMTVADMRAFDLGSTFDVVICLFSSIGYMRSIQDLDAAIESMARHLNPEGLLIVDGWLRPDAWMDRAPVQVLVATSEETTVARVGRSVRDRTATRLEMHYLIANQDGIEHVVELHELTLFSNDDYTAAFHRAGLSAELVAGPMEGRDRYLGVHIP
jgi:SAM-dependent methyltransferase